MISISINKFLSQITNKNQRKEDFSPESRGRRERRRIVDYFEEEGEDGGCTNRSKRNTRGTRRQFVSRRTSPFCSLRRLPTTRGKLFVRVSRGALRRRLARTDTPSVATLLSINGRTHPNGHFTFPPMDFVKIQPRPFETCGGEMGRREGWRRDASVPSRPRVSSLHVFSDEVKIYSLMKTNTV